RRDFERVVPRRPCNPKVDRWRTPRDRRRRHYTSETEPSTNLNPGVASWRPPGLALLCSTTGWGCSMKRLAGAWSNAPMVQSSSTSWIAVFELSPALPFRNPGHAQSLGDALASGEVGRVTALCVETVATEGKAWVERKSGLSGGPCLILQALQC